MASDWKDALAALAQSGNLPEGNESSYTENAADTDGPADNTKLLRILIDRKGRKGKTATIIEGFECDDDRLQQVAKTLKQKLGTGGSARDGEILVQGDRRKDIAPILNDLGYKTKII